MHMPLVSIKWPAYHPTEKTDTVLPSLSPEYSDLASDIYLSLLWTPSPAWVEKTYEQRKGQLWIKISQRKWSVWTNNRHNLSCLVCLIDCLISLSENECTL